MVARDIDEYLKECAALNEAAPADIVRRVLHLPPAGPKSRDLFPDANPEFLTLFENLDYAIKLRSPGFHYVRRTQYLGYRREALDTDGALGERSQVFVSVLIARFRSELHVVVPVDPSPYLKLPQVIDLRGRGHHGIGELKFVIASDSDIATFTETFDDWLRLQAPNQTAL